MVRGNRADIWWYGNRRKYEGGGAGRGMGLYVKLLVVAVKG